MRCHGQAESSGIRTSEGSQHDAKVREVENSSETEDLEAGRRRPMNKLSPKEPSEAERREHDLTHLPFRSWCKVCVQGKGRKDYTKQQFGTKPRIQVDYAFLTSDVTSEQVTCLTATDVTTGLCSSAVVPKKGVDDYAANELIRFILEAGRGGGELQPGVLKSDQESSIRALLRNVATTMSMSVKRSPTYHSQSQGAVER